jgi:CRISPR/Cas system-associated endonuclease Cas1
MGFLTSTRRPHAAGHQHLWRQPTQAGDRFLIQAGNKKFAVSALKVQSILLTTGANLSTDAIELAHLHNIDLVFLDRFGDPFARVWLTKMGSTASPPTRSRASRARPAT